MGLETVRSRNWKRHKQKMQYGEETIQQWQNGKIHKEGWLGNKATQVGRKERNRWKQGWVANQERREEEKKAGGKNATRKKTNSQRKTANGGNHEDATLMISNMDWLCGSWGVPALWVLTVLEQNDSCTDASSQCSTSMFISLHLTQWWSSLFKSFLTRWSSWVCESI